MGALDDLIAEVERHCAGRDWAERLTVAREIESRVRPWGGGLLAHYVNRARRDARSWAEIGAALGIPPAVARSRHTPPPPA
ncbi:hypothetical protein [Bailinhaonella thermotolerans]|uniref:Uncharacterized protein n=1 Tax=Bailinhaonella thermotolerans TaxID=1070861 RepID=A0A3A4AW63_9ACTN|nr:hypothetical protein [Bailinhaonella thermotolerans]RJL34470.1 hypothetical protein D5H75_08595 [Bailinhaonella thermotolerans]